MQNSLAEFWDSFLKDVLAAGLPEEDREILKDTFYAGAKAASMMCRGRTRQEARARVKRLYEELTEYQDGVLADMPESSKHIV